MPGECLAPRPSTLMTTRTPLPLEVVTWSFPDINAMRNGDGTIAIQSNVAVPLLDAGPHRLFFHNRNATSEHQRVSGERPDARERSSRGHGPAAQSRPERADHRLRRTRNRCRVQPSLGLDQPWRGVGAVHAIGSANSPQALVASRIEARPPSIGPSRRPSHSCRRAHLVLLQVPEFRSRPKFPKDLCRSRFVFGRGHNIR